MRALVVAGARPNFMKVSPILRALAQAGHTGILVHTGQHYDAQMSDAFFGDLDLPAPEYSLGVGSGTHAKQTALILERFEPVLCEIRPDWVVVVGDVNSTLACALVTSKLRHDLGCKLAHVEAGLRSHDWRMPEEVNRVVTDRISDLLLTPSDDAAANLDLEGIPPDRVVCVGNVMIDSLLTHLPQARTRQAYARFGVAHGDYAIATLHRPSNVDGPEELGIALRALARVSRELPVLLPLHPRTQQNAARFGLQEELARLTVLPPVSYLDMLSLSEGAALCLTDSGGLQEETTVLGVPCVTLREQTERPATITHGTNSMAPWPLSVDGIVAASQAARDRGRVPPGTRVPPGWDGAAGTRTVAALEAHRPPAR